MEKPLDRQYHNSGDVAQGSDSTRTRQRMSLVSSGSPRTADKTLLSVGDVVARFGGKKGAWWVRHHFAPKAKLKIGRSLFWYEDEAESWIREQRASR